MIKSMTGYGRGQNETGELTFSVEIKAVNHRYADIGIKSPRFLTPFETEIKKRVQKVLRRGKIDLYITQNHTEALTNRPVVDDLVAKAYVEAFQALKQISGLPGEISLEFLAGQKDVMVMKDAEFSRDDLEGCLYRAIDAALAAIQEMRKKEGEATATDIVARLDVLARTLLEIESLADRVPLEWQKKLHERLSRLQENDGDPQRIAQEIAIFADRCDISEEVTRFNSHLSQFRDLLRSDEPVGRQLDFLVQELNREANTMGSKSNDATLTRHVVTLKAELEKIREQVQNIE